MGEEESTLLELGKVKPIEEEEESNKAMVELSQKSKSKSKPEEANREEESKKGNIGELSQKSSKAEANREEEEQGGARPLPNWRRRHPCLACGGACCILFIVILVVILILAFTLFKVKDPRVHVDNITLESFNFSLPLNLPPTPSFHASLGLQLSLKNPNWASAKYTNSTAHMFYRGVEIGSFPIPPGHVGVRHTERIFSTIDVIADRLIGNSHIIGDLTSGSLPISTRTRVSGKVKVLHIYKHHFHTSSECNISIFTANRTISDAICTYDINL